MDGVIRLLILFPVVFLVGVAWAGQKHDNAKDTLHSGLRAAMRWTLWIVILVVVMRVVTALLID